MLGTDIQYGYCARAHQAPHCMTTRSVCGRPLFHVHVHYSSFLFSPRAPPPRPAKQQCWQIPDANLFAMVYLPYPPGWPARHSCLCSAACACHQLSPSEPCKHARTSGSHLRRPLFSGPPCELAGRLPPDAACCPLPRELRPATCGCFPRAPPATKTQQNQTNPDSSRQLPTNLVNIFSALWRWGSDNS